MLDLIHTTEESTTSLPTDSRYTHHRPSWVHPHPRSRSFSATSNSLLQHVKADANNHLTVASPGDGGDGPGDMAMFNRFASAQPLALVAQGGANVSGDSPLDYPLVKAEDNGFIEAIMCYLLKTCAYQIVPHTLPPPLGLLLDAFTRINEPDSIYGITMRKEVYAYLDLTQICGRKMLPKMPSSCYVLPQMQIGRFFSRRKRECVDKFSLKAKNSSILCLDGSSPEVRSSLRKVVAQLRQFCYDHGQHVDVSSMYGPGKVVYNPPRIGTFDLKVIYRKKWISFPIVASNLYFPAFRSENGLFVLEGLGKFTHEEDYKKLGFTCSYTVPGFGGQKVGDTWVGVEALRHSFHVISKSTGTTDSLKQALKIFVLHIAEAARIQSVLNAICHSMTDGGRTFLDETGASPAPPTSAPSPKTEASPGTSPPSSGTETEAGPSVLPATSPPSSVTEAAPVASPPTPPPSYWIGTYAHYSAQALRAIEKVTRNEKYIIKSKGAYQVTSLDDILKQIRILSRREVKKGGFAQEAPVSLLPLPKECARGKEVEHPYVLLQEWDTGKCL